MLLTVSIFILGITAAFGDFQNHPGCGQRPLIEDDNIKVVNGAESRPGDWGWSVSLTNNGRHFCGGVLISKRYVLTAAHCIYGNRLTQSYRVEIGVHDRNNKESVVQTIQIEKWWTHESYNQFILTEDIALIKLEKEVEFDDYAVPACIYLPSQNEPIEGRFGTVTGWGAERSGGPGTIKKMEGTIQALSKQRCQTRYGARLNPEKQICAGEDDANAGACQGDSGGPYVAKGSDGKWYLYGLVSWGFGCGAGTVFNRVEYYISWINGKIALN